MIRTITVLVSCILSLTLTCSAQIKVDAYHFVDLPFYTEECATELPVPFELHIAKIKIDSIFNANGYSMTDEGYFEQDSIEFPLTGYSKELNLGYVWLDWQNLSMDAIDIFFYHQRDRPWQALIPDLGSKYDEYIIDHLSWNYSGSIDSTVSELAVLTSNEIDSIKKNALYTKTLEEFVLKGVFWTVEFDTTRFNDQIRNIVNPEERHWQLNRLLSFQKLLRLKSFYNNQDSLNSVVESIVDTLSLNHSERVHNEYQTKYEKRYVSTIEVQHCLEEKNLPMNVLLFQSNHQSLTVPSRYGRDFHLEYYIGVDKQKYARLDSIFDTYSRQLRHKRVSRKLKKMDTETHTTHVNRIHQNLETSILEAINKCSK